MRVISKRALLFCQAFIGFPLKYALGSSGVTGLTFSPAVLCWGLTITFLQLACICYEIYMISIGNESPLLVKSGSNVSLLAVSLIHGSVLLMGVVLVMNYATKYPTFLKVCTILEKFDHNLQLGTLECCNTENSLIIVLCTVSKAILFGAILCSGYSEVRMFRESMTNILNLFAFYGRIGLLIHFQQVAYGITKRFRLVNDRIRLEVLSQYLRRNLILLQNPPCVDLPQDSVSGEKLKSLMSSYHLLSVAVYQANDFYGMLLLVSVFTAFVGVTEALHFFLLEVAKEDAMVICLLASAIFYDASFLVVVALSGSGVSEAAGETAPLLRKLMNQDLDSEMREQLKSFFLQLIDKTEEFSAGGFFQINRQTLSSMAAAVITYLVIKIQFETEPN